MKRYGLLIAAVVALVAVATATASAAELEVANGGAVNAVSSGKLTFTAATATIACNVTLALELLRGPIAKVEGARVGSVRGVRWAECVGGEMGEVLGLPWELTYSSIEGSLPSLIRRIWKKLRRIKIRPRIFFELVDCLYEGDVGLGVNVTLIRGTTERYTSGSVIADEAETQSYVSGPEACPSSGHMRGTFNLSATQTITRR